MTLTFELDPDSVKLNQHAQRPVRRSLSSKIIVRTHRHARTDHYTLTTKVSIGKNATPDNA